MTQTQKLMARLLRAKGLKNTEIARVLNYTQEVIRVTVRECQIRDGKSNEWSPAPGRLSAQEREDCGGPERRGVDVLDRSSPGTFALDRHP